MTDAKNTRRARKRTLARGSKKKPHVVPLPITNRPVHLGTSYVNRRTLSHSSANEYFLPYEARECEMARLSGVTRIMNPQLSEALGLAGVYGAIIRPLLVAISLFALWHALARTNLGSRQRLLAWTAVAAALVLWLTFVWTLALQGRLVPEPGAPRVLQIGVVLVPMIILIISALTLLTRSQTIAAAVDAAPLW